MVRGHPSTHLNPGHIFLTRHVRARMFGWDMVDGRADGGGTASSEPRRQRKC